jgi:integrase
MQRRSTRTRDLALAVRPASELSTPQASPVTWERALEVWRVKLQSETTRATYCGQVRAFARVPGVPELAVLDVDVLDAYAGALRMHASKEAPPAERLAPSTVNLKLAALRSFLSFCRRRGWLSPLLTGEAIHDALEGLRATVQRPYQIVEGDELGAMLDAAAANAYDAPRALALLALALGAGLRVAELCDLDVGDLASDATGCYVDVREGKGHKQRQVPIAQDVYELVAAYLTVTGRAVHRTADRGTPLFLSRKCRSGAGRLTTRQARRVIVATAKRASVASPSLQHKRITPHALRHSYALDVLAGDPATGRAGAPLPAVTKLLGHSSVAVTGRYLNHFERRDLGAYAPSLRRQHASPQAV